MGCERLQDGFSEDLSKGWGGVGWGGLSHASAWPAFSKAGHGDNRGLENSFRT